jgi:threonine/homoserine/homoserine lactone efflux protein
MLAALSTVIVMSLSGVMAPGPMFTMTLAKSLKSPWAGAQVSLGHAVIEVPLILLVIFSRMKSSSWR